MLSTDNEAGQVRIVYLFAYTSAFSANWSEITCVIYFYYIYFLFYFILHEVRRNIKNIYWLKMPRWFDQISNNQHLALLLAEAPKYSTGHSFAGLTALITKKYDCNK